MIGVVLTISVSVLVEAMLIHGLAHTSHLYSLFFVFNFKITIYPLSVFHMRTWRTSKLDWPKILLMSNSKYCLLLPPFFNTECFQLVYYFNCPSYFASSVDIQTIRFESKPQYKLLFQGNTPIQLRKCIFSENEENLHYLSEYLHLHTYLSSKPYMHLIKIRLQ